jgi:hypothetical protein
MVLDSTIDKLEIDTNHPTNNHCCVDDCIRTPTFELQVYLGDVLKGKVFICMHHYITGQKFPGIIAARSTVIQKLCREDI